MPPPAIQKANHRLIWARGLVTAIRSETGGFELQCQYNGKFGQGTARRHRSSQEGGGIFPRRAATETATDQLAQPLVLLPVTLQVVLKQIRPAADILFLMPACKKTRNRPGCYSTVR